MVKAAVSVLRSGEKLIEEVRTKYGSLLMEKGRILSAKDLDVLRAFLIDFVEVEGVAEDKQREDTLPSDIVSNGLDLFYEKYDELFKIMKETFRVVAAGNDRLPLVEIRSKIEDAIEFIDFYNPLTFYTKRMNLREDYLIHNSLMVGFTSYKLARWESMPAKNRIPIVLAGLLHDIGNTRIDPAILHKPSKLLKNEYEEVKKHTIIGYNILKNIAGINEGVVLTALQHHERDDGSGYPLGLKKDKIHPYAKIVAVADVFHAMTTTRQYKEAISPYLGLEQLMIESFGKLDPAIVRLFIHKITQLHNGTVVRLDDGSIGEIVFTDRNNPTRPMVNVNGKIVNLALEMNRYIQEVIST